jgi:hypothetical protein
MKGEPHLLLPEDADIKRVIESAQTAKRYSDDLDLQVSDLSGQVNILYAAQKYKGAPPRGWMAKQKRLILDGKVAGYEYVKTSSLSARRNLQALLESLAPLHAEYVASQRKARSIGSHKVAGEESGKKRKAAGFNAAVAIRDAYPLGRTARQIAKAAVAVEEISNPTEVRRRVATITRKLRRHGVAT